MKCVVVLRPTEESIQACESELSEGRYDGYWLCEFYSLSLFSRKRELTRESDACVPDFTNTLTKLQIERLAEADRFELVQEVQVSTQLALLFRLSLFSRSREY